MKPNAAIHIVLVGSLYSRNVGSVSRVMANMGAQRLILIRPECEINLEARQGAAGAQTHLMELSRYDSWDDFFQKEPEGVRIAFCAKHKQETDDSGFAGRLQILKTDRLLEAQPLYLIFGPEDHGLSNDDVKFANFICQLPIFGPFTSLNLSHAALLALFMAREVFAVPGVTTLPAVASVDDNGTYQFPEEAVQTWLETLGFEIGDRRTDVYKVIKRILLRNIASAKELRILEAVIFQTLRKLP